MKTSQNKGTQKRVSPVEQSQADPAVSESLADRSAIISAAAAKMSSSKDKSAPTNSNSRPLQILLTGQQRLAFTAVPTDLSQRELARYYTFSETELKIINRRRRGHNRLGFAVQLALLKYPGRTLSDVGVVPLRLINYVAVQLGIEASLFTQYGLRENTLYEHLGEIREQFGFVNCGWRQLLALTRSLLPVAIESERSLPLVEMAISLCRDRQVIAPGITTIERLVLTVQRLAEKRVYSRLNRSLSDEQKLLLDALLVVDPRLTRPTGEIRVTEAEAEAEALGNYQNNSAADHRQLLSDKVEANPRANPVSSEEKEKEKEKEKNTGPSVSPLRVEVQSWKKKKKKGQLPKVRTRLGWLREPLENPSAHTLAESVERILYIKALKLPIPTEQVPRNRVVQLARRCGSYGNQPLSNFKPLKRYALLAAYLHDLLQTQIDDAVEMFDQLMLELLRKGERCQEIYFADRARTQNSNLALLTQAVEAFLRAYTDKLDPFTTVFEAVGEKHLEATVQSAKQNGRPADSDYLDLIEAKYSRLRASLMRWYQTLTFHSVRGREKEPCLLALDHVVKLEKLDRRVGRTVQRVGQTTYEAPLTHLNERWRKHTVRGKKVVSCFYEAAAFEVLKARLRSGDISVVGSRRYLSFESYLLPKPNPSSLGDPNLSDPLSPSGVDLDLELETQPDEDGSFDLLLQPDSDALELNSSLDDELGQTAVEAENEMELEFPAGFDEGAPSIGASTSVNQNWGLAISGSAHSYLDSRQSQLEEWLRLLVGSIGEPTCGIRLDEKGKLHEVALKKEVTAANEAARDMVYDYLPRLGLAEMLLEVNEWTGFMRHFTHLSSGEATTGERKLTLLAAIMGLGLNLGLGKLAESSTYTYRQLSWAAEWHIRDETLSRAMAELDNFVLSQPFSRYRGDGSRSSSDGMRFKVGVKNAEAVPNARYFGTGRGITLYTHVADISMPFYGQLISTNDREALYVLDGLNNHESDIAIKEHFTDTNGFSEHLFALSALLGYRFAPRIKNVLGQRLYTTRKFEEKLTGGENGATWVNDLVKFSLSRKPIIEQWDEILRIGASIKRGKVSAVLLMQKLAAYPRQNRIARALGAMGKLEKTVFILGSLYDEDQRRRSEVGLNKGEAINGLGRAVFFGQHGELRDRAFADQSHRASCLLLVVAAICAWNTVYLEQVLGHLRANGQAVAEEHLAHIGPMGWEHLNFLGRYNFDPKEGRSLNNLRPLRQAKDIGLVEDNE